MPVITFFQTKGGTGKTTSAFLLAEFLSKKPNVSVTVIDADQNHPFAEWKKDGGEGENFSIVTEPDEEKIPIAIGKASETSAIVIVDTEGSPNTTAARAAAMSDLVIVTSTGTPLDQKHAAKAVKFVAKAGKQAGRKIPVSVLMTRQKAVGVSRTVRNAIEMMRNHGVHVFDCQLIERDAYGALFGYATLLFDLDEKKVGGKTKAYMNARVYVNQVVRRLDEVRSDQQQTPSKSDKEAA